jgi:hypothetical protein
MGSCTKRIFGGEDIFASPHESPDPAGDIAVKLHWEPSGGSEARRPEICEKKAVLEKTAPVCTILVVPVTVMMPPPPMAMVVPPPPTVVIINLLYGALCSGLR